MTPVRKTSILLALLAILTLVLLTGVLHTLLFELPQIQEGIRGIIQAVQSFLEQVPSASSSLEIQQSVSFSLVGQIVWTNIMLVGWGIVWLTLIYQTAKNAQFLNGAPMKVSPFQCMISFLIPIGNLWMSVKAMLEINAVLCGKTQVCGRAWIWLTWFINLPLVLLTFLSTLITPLITFMAVFQNLGTQEQLTLDQLSEATYSILNSCVEPLLLYNGVVFMLCLLSSLIMVTRFHLMEKRAFSSLRASA